MMRSLKKTTLRMFVRLGVFASITADQERNVGKSLKHIYVMGKEAEQHPVSSLFVDFVEEGINSIITLLSIQYSLKKCG